MNPAYQQLFDIAGRVCLITGASKGIGLVLAREFCRLGAHVAMTYNSDDSAIQSASNFSKEFGVKCKAYHMKSESSSMVQTTVSQVLKDFGKLDIAIANAAEGWQRGACIDQPVEEFEKHMQVNLFGTYYFCHAVGPIFREQGHGSLIINASMSGHIVNVSDVKTDFQMAPYNTSKAAVIHLAKNLAVEWAAFAKVNSVSEGYISTEAHKRIDPAFAKDIESRVPLKRAGTCEEVVGIYLYFASAASDYARTDFVLDGGYCLL